MPQGQLPIGYKAESSRDFHYRRYQLQWRPTFTREAGNSSGPYRSYIAGEQLKLIGEDALNNATDSYDNRDSLDTFIRVGYNSVLTIPFNTSIALAQEYTPSIKNKLVVYNTLGGNTVTTFGQSAKRIGLRIRIIKAGKNWESYYKMLEAVTYLSANQGRFFGSLFLYGYDVFQDFSSALSGRYKVAVESLDFAHRSETNTTLTADLQMIVIHDYTAQTGNKTQVWGSL